MYHNEDSAPRCAELLLSERGVIPHQLPPGHPALYRWPIVAACSCCPASACDPLVCSDMPLMQSVCPLAAQVARVVRRLAVQVR